MNAKIIQTYFTFDIVLLHIWFATPLPRNNRSYCTIFLYVNLFWKRNEYGWANII